MLGWSKFIGFADDHLILAQIVRFVLKSREKTVGKGENAGNQQALSFLLLKHGIVW